MNVLEVMEEISKLLIGKKSRFDVDSEKLALILLDGVRYDCMKSVAESYGFEVERIRSIFPSSTAPVVTSLSTLKSPGEHGLLEWNLYVPEINMVIESLPFRPAGSKCYDELEKIADPRILFEGETIWQKLKRENVSCEALVDVMYQSSAYSKLAYNGANMSPIVTITDLCVRLRKLMNEKDGLFHAYYASPDFVAHVHGLGEEYYFDVEIVFKLLLEEVIKKVKNATFFVISDHGMVPVSRVFYLDEILKKEYLKKDSRGLPVAFGGPRVLFLNVEDKEKVKRILEEKLDFATVKTKEELVSSGIFGNLTEFAKKRIGDIAILPKGNFAVWFRRFDEDTLRLKAVHGGLSDEEMSVPLIRIET